MSTLAIRPSLFPGLSENPLTEARRVLQTAVSQERPAALYAMFSGGNDSLSAALVTSQHPLFGGCVHINTGTGIPATTEYVRATCAAQGWPLFELSPPERQYADLVLEFGFPGPAAHRFMYSWLKERALRQFVAAHKQHARDRVGLVTGVRRAESRRRMGGVKPILREGAKLWIAPLYHFDSLEIQAFIAASGVPANPVVARMGFSGECLCGSFADPGEFNRLAQEYPETAARIDCLAEAARRSGVHAVWGERPPVDRYGLAQACGQMMLCLDCEFRQEAIR